VKERIVHHIHFTCTASRKIIKYITVPDVNSLQNYSIKNYSKTLERNEKISNCYKIN